jgi:replicative DNA helicase
MAVLGSMLLGSRGAVERASTILSRDDFYRDAHRYIFEAMCDLAAKSEPCDIVTVKDALNRKGILDGVGGIGGVGYLMQLGDIQFTTANLEFYAKIVSDKAILRRTIEACYDLATAAYGQEVEADALVEDAERRFMAIRPQRGADTAQSLKILARKELTALDERNAAISAAASSADPIDAPSPIAGISTGFHALDWYLSGLKPSDFILLAARPSVGKTALAACIAANVTKAGYTTAFFTLEMSREQMTQRILTAEGRVDSHAVRTGQMQSDDWKRILAGTDRLWRGECIIDDNTTVTPAYLRSKLRRIKAEHGLHVVIIDYIGLMTANSGGSGSGRRNDTRNEELSQISRSLKLIAKEFNVAVIALSQLSRGVERRDNKRPILSDLRDSGSLEQDADVVAFLHRESYQTDAQAAHDDFKPDPTEVIIRKQRNGPVCTVHLGFTAAYARFDNITLEPNPNSTLEPTGIF